MYCLACRINKISQWTVRILGELSKNPKNAFITLTYNNEEIQFEDNIMTLRKRHVQLFNKRLRLELTKNDLNYKYFFCGEYGDTTLRPHYHGLIIGVDIKDLQDVNTEKIWGKGMVNYGAVTTASIRYVLSYIITKDNPEHYEPAEPPFQISSNLFGNEWIDENIEKICKDGYFTYGKRKITIPKFIKDYYEIPNKGPVQNRIILIKKNKKSVDKEKLKTYIKSKEADKQEWTKKTLEKKEELKKQREPVKSVM